MRDATRALEAAPTARPGDPHDPGLRKILRVANTTRLATYLIALWKLFKHPQTPRLAKWTAVAVLAYAVSPIDLVPDFIPVLGQLDDLVLIPLGIALIVRLTPTKHGRRVWPRPSARATSCRGCCGARCSSSCCGRSCWPWRYGPSRAWGA